MYKCNQVCNWLVHLQYMTEILMLQGKAGHDPGRNSGHYNMGGSSQCDGRQKVKPVWDGASDEISQAQVVPHGWGRHTGKTVLKDKMGKPWSFLGRIFGKWKETSKAVAWARPIMSPLQKHISILHILTTRSNYTQGHCIHPKPSRFFGKFN